MRLETPRWRWYAMFSDAQIPDEIIFQVKVHTPSGLRINAGYAGEASIITSSMPPPSNQHNQPWITMAMDNHGLTLPEVSI